MTDRTPHYVIRSAIGIFLMDSVSSNIYEGIANQRKLRVTVTNEGSPKTFSAELISEVDGDTISDRFEGSYLTSGGLTDHIALWLNELFGFESALYSDPPKFFQSSGGKMAYWEYNTHLDTTPVVFVHGGPGGDSNVDKARRLCLANPIYLFDQIGCGFSEPITDYDSWTLDVYVKQMEEFIDSIPAEKVILIGASWGAGLSLAYADTTSFRKVAAMVLPSPFLSSKLWTEDMWQNLRSMGEHEYDVVRKAIENNDYGNEFVKVLGEYNARFLFTRRYYRPYAEESAKEKPNETFRRLNGPNDMVIDGKLKDFDVTSALRKINVPVLFICGDSDEVPVSRIVSYHEQVKGSRLSVIPEAGHVLSLEQFDLYRDSILAFFREIGYEQN